MIMFSKSGKTEVLWKSVRGQNTVQVCNINIHINSPTNGEVHTYKTINSLDQCIIEGTYVQCIHNSVSEHMSDIEELTSHT